MMARVEQRQKRPRMRMIMLLSLRLLGLILSTNGFNSFFYGSWYVFSPGNMCTINFVSIRFFSFFPAFLFRMSAPSSYSAATFPFIIMLWT